MTVHCKKHSASLAIALSIGLGAGYAAPVQAQSDTPALANPLQTSGVVGAVEGNHRFTLRHEGWENNTIEIISQRPLTLHEGDVVRVTGMADRNTKNGTLRIVADDIKLSRAESKTQTLPAHVTAAAQGTPAAGMTPPEHTAIKDLPSTGAVKVIGVVEKIPDNKSLSLRDNTGTLQVNTEALDKPLPAIGTEVTILGTMQSGLLQKQLVAQQLSAVSTPPTQAQK